MSAPNTVLNSTDMSLRNAVVGCDKALWSSIRFNCLYLNSCKFGNTRFFAPWKRSVPYSVGVIIFAGVPPQIRQMIVQWVAVIMAAVHFRLRHGADKRLNNKLMYGVRSIYTAFREICERAAVAVDERLFHKAMFYRPDVSVVRNKIEVLIPKDWFPVFHAITLWYNRKGCQ